jgi:hypothetical protein
MAGMRLAADFPDLLETRRALEAAADGLGRALNEELAKDAQPLLVTTRALTALGPGPYPGADPDSDNALPHIRDMYSVVVAGGTISLIAHHPGAVVHEWGGTIRPRGVPITFKAEAMARRAAVKELPEIERAIDERISRLL